MGTHFIIIEIQFIRVIFFRSDSSAYFNFFHFCIIGGIEERKCHFGFAIRSRRPTASPCTSTGLQVTVNKFQIPIRETFSRSSSHHAPEFHRLPNIFLKTSKTDLDGQKISKVRSQSQDCI